MRTRLLFLATITLTLVTSAAWSQQCPPGIPEAGNPNCIPPDQPTSPLYNSPYNNSNANQQQPAQPQTVWADQWGAIAFDGTTGQAGTVDSQESEASAERLALNLCARNGSKNCKIILPYRNQCAAVTQRAGGGMIYASGAPNQKQAEKNAITQCSDNTCKIVYSTCSYAKRIQ